MPQVVTTEIVNGIGWITLDNPPVNATSTAVRAALSDAIAQVQGCDLAVLKCAGRTFIAGGDVSEFDAPPAPPHLPDVVADIENSAAPFVALLHGTVLGGGFEIAMACAARIARPGTRFGLPEVKLGLIPGAGGTQRAPRLLGWDMAVEMACMGAIKSAEDLMTVGGIDRISDDPEAEVETFRNLKAAKVSDRRIAPMTQADLDRFQAQVRRSAKGQTAPMQNLTALQWASSPYSVGQPKERALHLKLRGSDESRSLRHLFFAERAVKAPGFLKGVQPRALNTLAIVGGGLMGSGIAAACLIAGYNVSIIERDSAAADAAQATVTTLLQGALDRGKISQPGFDAKRAALVTSDSYQAAAGADLAIEAVFEDLSAKTAVFAALANVVGRDCLLATNTSYINPDEIFAGIPAAERCLGIHFFSPAHIMRLVEVVRASETSDTALATAFAFAKTLRKTPVLSGICDGFIGNRILAAYRRAAEYLLVDGALPHQIDGAMRAFGMAMGPFETQDQSGLQIALANRRRQEATRNPGERYVPILDQLCELGRLGRRSGAGWYSYPGGGARGQRDPDVDALVAACSAAQGIARKTFSDQDMQMLLLAAMANEGARIVEDGIAENAATIDVVKTAGYGFPRWRGGPMHWARTMGPGAMQAALTQLEQASPGSWTRAAAFRNVPSM